MRNWKSLLALASIGMLPFTGGVSATEKPATDREELRACLKEARQAFHHTLQDWRENRTRGKNRNKDTAEAVQAAVEAFRDALAECRGDTGDLEQDPCWQSAREAFLAALSDCREKKNNRRPCIKAAVEAMVAEIRACRDNDTTSN